MRSLSALIFTVIVLPSSAFGQSDPVLDEFPIVGWGLPHTRDANFETYRQAHFNVIQLPGALTSGTNVHRASRLGLKVMLVEPQDGGSTPGDWVRFANAYDNVMGWLLDERTAAEDVEGIIGFIRELRQRDKRRWPLVTLPDSDTAGGWSEVLGPLFAAGLPTLCYHRYSFFEDGTSDEEGFYTDLEIARSICAKTKVPLWGMILVTGHGLYRNASDSDIRLQVYSYLASGARGLCYDAYWPLPPDPSKPEAQGTAPGQTMVNRDTGTRSFAWEIAEAINGEVLTLAPSLLKLTSTGTYFIRAVPGRCKALPHATYPIASIEAEKAMVGFFKDAESQTWAMIVNRRHGAMRNSLGRKSTMRVFVDSKVSRIVEVDRVTGYEKDIPIQEGNFLITIPGVTGSLIRLEMDAAR